MNRPAPLGLGTALFLLAAAFAFASAQQPPVETNTATAPAVSEDPAAAAQNKLHEDADQARKGVESLLRQLPAKASSDQLKAALENQQRLETLVEVALGLLALTALLTSASLLLVLQQRKALLSLAREGRALEPAGTRETLDTPAKEKSDAGDFPAPSGTGGATTAAGPAVSPTTDDEELLASLPARMRHREVALLLAKLCREAPRLAERFASSELRKQFRGELDAPVHARLNRLIALSDRDDELLRERWLGPDLVTTLDTLARFYSEAVAEERNGHVTGLAHDLHGWLYSSFGSACRNEGWFAIDLIEPYKTRFNPKIHYAVDGRDVDGAEGQIIAIKAIGRRDAKTGSVKHQAEVIVGR